MIAMRTDYQFPGGWTDEDFDRLPDHIRYEIEDGNLVACSRPALWHQASRARLAASIDDQCPTDWLPIQAGEIRVYAGSLIDQLRAPDVMLVPRQLVHREAIRGWAHPDEVLFTAEVVSPASRTADRATKVVVYAAWGIPLYLRLETRPDVVLYEYRLDQATKRYGEPSAHRGVFATDDPFPFELDLSGWN